MGQWQELAESLKGDLRSTAVNEIINLLKSIINNELKPIEEKLNILVGSPFTTAINTLEQAELEMNLLKKNNYMTKLDNLL